jgi:hypothetical protein
MKVTEPMHEGTVFQCCFCGRAIESAPPDPCRLEVRVNHEDVRDAMQELFCHALCLRKVLPASIPTLLDAI